MIDGSVEIWSTKASTGERLEVHEVWDGLEKVKENLSMLHTGEGVRVHCEVHSPALYPSRRPENQNQLVWDPVLPEKLIFQFTWIPMRHSAGRILFVKTQWLHHLVLTSAKDCSTSSYSIPLKPPDTPTPFTGLLNATIDRCELVRRGRKEAGTEKADVGPGAGAGAESLWDFEYVFEASVLVPPHLVDLIPGKWECASNRHFFWESAANDLGKRYFYRYLNTLVFRMPLFILPPSTMNGVLSFEFQ